MRMPAAEFQQSLRCHPLTAPRANGGSCVQERLRGANELSLGARITQMITPFNDLFGSKSARKAFIWKVVSTRNYLTHYDQGSKNQAVTDPQELLKLHRKLEVCWCSCTCCSLLGIKHDPHQENGNQVPCWALARETEDLLVCDTRFGWMRLCQQRVRRSMLLTILRLPNVLSAKLSPSLQATIVNPPTSVTLDRPMLARKQWQGWSGI